MWKYHKIVPNAASAAALALKEGCDLICGSTYKSLGEAVQNELIAEADLGVDLKRLFWRVLNLTCMIRLKRLITHRFLFR